DSDHGMDGFHFDIFDNDDPPAHSPEPVPEPDPNPKKINYRFHEKLTGRRCDSDGAFLPAGAPPPLANNPPAGNDW
ncbi:hypothetical protein AAF712_016650, partial [Marasmius tenuissimus]